MQFSQLKSSVFGQVSTEECVRIVAAFINNSPHQLSDMLDLIQGLMDANKTAEATEVLPLVTAHYGEHLSLIMLAGNLALKLELNDMAVKMFTRACQMDQSMSTNFHHLAEALSREKQYAEAIEILKSALEAFPDDAPLWHALGRIYYEFSGDVETSLKFVAQAKKLDLSKVDYYLTIANICYKDKIAEQNYLEGLKIAPRHPELNMSYGLFLLNSGRMEEAWVHYEYRLLTPPNLFKYDVDIGKKWKFNDIGEAPLIILAEQGIGDEVAFSSILPSVIKEVKTVYIVCEPRLESIYKRSFPDAQIIAYEDEVKFGNRIRRLPALKKALEAKQLPVPQWHIHLASLMQHYWTTYAAYAAYSGNCLTPDPALVASFQKRIKEMGSCSDSGTKKIAISWTSKKLEGLRGGQYYEHDIFIEIAKRSEADFYILQYGCPADVRDKLCQQPNIYAFEDIDLKENIEANMALLSLMDVAIGPFIATQSFAMAVGTPVWGMHSCESFFMFGKDVMPPLYGEGSRWIKDYHLAGHSLDLMIDELCSAINHLPAKEKQE